MTTHSIAPTAKQPTTNLLIDTSELPTYNDQLSKSTESIKNIDIKINQQITLIKWLKKRINELEDTSLENMTDLKMQWSDPQVQIKILEQYAKLIKQIEALDNIKRLY